MSQKLYHNNLQFNVFYRIIGLWLLLGVAFSINAQETEIGKEASSSNQKPTLLVFSGSDWCLPCIQLKKKVLDDSCFRSFCKNKLEIRIADFPQKQKLSAELVKENEALAERYNRNGMTPLALLIRTDQSVWGYLETKNPDPKDWIVMIERLLSKPR